MAGGAETGAIRFGGTVTPGRSGDAWRARGEGLRGAGCTDLPGDRPLRNPGLVARKTPHPNPLPQEREQERTHLRDREAFCKGLPGEGNERRRLEGIDPAHPFLGLCKGLHGEREQEQSLSRGRGGVLQGSQQREMSGGLLERTGTAHPRLGLCRGLPGAGDDMMGVMEDSDDAVIDVAMRRT